MSTANIRAAHPDDRPQILSVVENAFGSREEVDLVERIWASAGYDTNLDLVAEIDGRIVGHALFSIGQFDNGVRAPALAPLAVHSGQQSKGLGSALITEGLRRCRQSGWPVVIVTGHWDYYPRFGFEPAMPLGIRPVNPETLRDRRAFMVHQLGPTATPTGVYRYCWQLPETAGLTHPSFPLASWYDSDWLLSLDMGPNPLWLLEELLQQLAIESGMRVLDLGCGRAATSVFLAKEFGAEVWAVDAWVPAEQIRSTVANAGVAGSVHVANADARALPYEAEFVDAIISIDAWEYFGTDDRFLPMLLRVLRAGGQIGMATPGMKRDPRDLGHIPDHIRDAVGWEALAWHRPTRWKEQWELTGLVTDVRAEEAATGWSDWLRWSRITAGDHAHEDPSVRMLSEDAGELLTFALVSGVKS